MEANKQKRVNGLARRQRRVRGKISGTAERPRIRVTRSNTNIYAQVIDDKAGKTLVSASSLDASIKANGKGSTVEAAKAVGELLGQRCQEAGITEAVFDRGGNLYHGRVQALADGVRSAGIKF